MRTISASTLLVAALACQRVAATWSDAAVKPAVENIDNTGCTQDMEGGYTFQSLTTGRVDSYDAVNLRNFECEEDQRKLKKRTVSSLLHWHTDGFSLTSP